MKKSIKPLKEWTDKEIVEKETGSRTVNPKKTIEKARNYFQEIGVANVKQIEPKFTDNIPIFQINESNRGWKCHRALYKWSEPPSPLNNPSREVFGKGITVEQAKASAIMEAVERYCAQIFSRNNVKEEYEEYENRAIPLSDFNFPNSVPPKCRNCRMREIRCFSTLGKMSKEWNWGYSLTKDEPVLVPSALVYYPYVSKHEESFMFNDTSGLASGNTFEEAISSGIGEVIERDALYNTFFLNKRDMLILEFEDLSIKNEYVHQFVDGAVSLDKIYTFLIENTISLNIPTVTALICHVDGNKGYVFGGSGTHLDPEVALIRALTEMEQQKVRKKKLMRMKDNSLLSSKRTPIKKKILIKEIPDHSTRSTREDLQFYCEELSRQNLEAIAVNLTRPNIGIPTVRIIIPELIEYEMPLKKEVLINILGAEKELKTIE